MKYAVVIIDGAAGLPIPDKGGKTSLELAHTPHLDAMAASGRIGMVRTVPPGMEPSSALACMSVIGYDPVVYYKGRASIEAKSLGIDILPGEVVFRCNLVTVKDGIMKDYSGGHITTPEAKEIVKTLNERLGGNDVEFYPGTGYRQYVKLRGREESLQAVCTGPHDIPDKKVEEYLPHGEGSKFIRNLMRRSEPALRDHPVNISRRTRGLKEISTIWLFWGAGPAPGMPSFKEAYGISAAMTSGVDLLRGLAKMSAMYVLEIPGVTDGPDNDYLAQAEGAVKALKDHDLVVVHIESPDEAGHGGRDEEKIKAIEDIDREVIGTLLKYENADLRILVMPDHPTPLTLRTHTPEPVPFLLWGKGIQANGADTYSEAAAAATGVFIEKGYTIMRELVG